MIHDEIQKAREIMATLGADDPDLVEIITNETDVHKILDWAVAKYTEETHMQAGIKSYQDALRARKDASEARQEKLKSIMGEILSVTGERTYRAPCGTISKKSVPPKKIITDETKIPDNFWKYEKTLDKSAINAFDGPIDGVEMSNGGETLSVRK